MIGNQTGKGETHPATCIISQLPIKVALSLHSPWFQRFELHEAACTAASLPPRLGLNTVKIKR